MTTKQIREKIQSYLVRGEIEEALNLLISGLDSSQQRRDHDNALMLKAKWENIKQEQLRGIISRQEYEVSVNKIIAGVQTITNEIDYAEKSKSEIHNNIKVSKIWLILIPFICIIGLIGWYIATNKTDRISEPSSQPTSKIVDTNPDSQGNKSKDRSKSVSDQNQVLRPKQNESIEAPAKSNQNASTSVQSEIKQPTVTTQPVSSKTYRVTLVVNSAWSDAKIFVDDKRAEVIKDGLLFKEIMVTETNTSHRFRLEKPGMPPCEKVLRVLEDTRVPMTTLLDIFTKGMIFRA